MERIGSLLVAPSTDRKAEPGRFRAALDAAAHGVAAGVATSVALAAPFVPAGAVLAGAIRPAAASGGSRPGGSPGPGAAPAPAAGSGASAGGGGDVVEATRALQQEAQSFNLQYLQLQESMQRESREFTALSNVMKVKHDTAKSAINNVH